MKAQFDAATETLMMSTSDIGTALRIDVDALAMVISGRCMLGGGRFSGTYADAVAFARHLLKSAAVCPAHHLGVSLGGEVQPAEPLAAAVAELRGEIAEIRADLGLGRPAPAPSIHDAVRKEPLQE